MARFTRGRGGWVTLGTVVGLLVALGATMFGLGAADHAVASANASAWLWSAAKGEVSRVNGDTGKVDTRAKVFNAQGHLVQVSQTDRYVVLRDLSTGTVSALDLATLQLAASSQTTPGLGVSVALSGDAGFLIDTVQGLVRQFDPLTLAPVGDPLRFPPGISGGVFDTNGTLWLLVSTEGTVVGVRPAPPRSAPPGGKPADKTAADDKTAAGPTVTSTVPVADPGHDLTLSTLDKGVAVLDQTSDTLTTVLDGQTHTLHLPLTGTGTMPTHTASGALAVTVADQRRLYVIDQNHVHDFAVPGSGDGLAPAVAFAGLFYVPDNTTGAVYVLTPSGKLTDTITIAQAGGPLTLEVRGGHLFINAPGGSTARVVDGHHRVMVVDKYANNVLGGDPPPSPPPPPPPPPGPVVGPPGAPTKVTAVAGNASAHLRWGAAPAHGSAITKYVVQGDGKTHEVGARQRSLDLTGLTNGRQYTFTVYAVNAKGKGPRRAANPVVPTSAVPDPPTKVTAKENKDGTVTLTWPAANGQGHKIIRYDVTAISGGTAVDPLRASGTTLTIPAGTLTYGTQYAFTVTSVNDRGASSAASPPSNTVVPYTLPGAPKSLTVRTVDARGTVSVAWAAAADNGRAITGYEVSAAGKTTTVTGATSTSLAGFGNGITVTVSVAAVNLAGTGPAAKGTAKTIDKPAITATGAASAGFNSISVPFTVTANGSPPTCAISINGGAARGLPCTGGSAGGLWPGNTYSYTVTATNKAGSASISGSASTPAVTGTVVCTVNSYCGHGSTTGGIWVYPQPTQTSKEVGPEFAPAQVSAQCWTTDSKGATINAGPYGGRKDNRWLRISFKGNNFIPYAWVNLNGGATIGSLPHC